MFSSNAAACQRAAMRTGVRISTILVEISIQIFDAATYRTRVAGGKSGLGIRDYGLGTRQD